MRATERVNLLNAISATLQQRYTFDEIDDLFAAIGVKTEGFERGSSKRTYVKDVLRSETEAQIVSIAQDLELSSNSNHLSPQPPENWRDTTKFRLFISHISKDKQIATRLREALASYAISGFVAHQDIHPTLAWQDEIERGLQTMDAMVAVHTEGFSKSGWTQQEIGFALGRGTKIISFKYGEDPTGFIGKHQALPRMKRTAEQIASEIERLLLLDPKTESRLREAKGSEIFVQSVANPFEDEKLRRAAAKNFFDPRMKLGTRVKHAKFGVGQVAEIDGNKLEIDFDSVGRKRVMTAFVSLANADSR